MAHAFVDHVGHGFEPAMGMFGEASNVIAGFVGAKLVEHQKRVEIIGLGRADNAP